MKNISQAELFQLLESRELETRIDLSDRRFENMDLTGWNLDNIDFRVSAFENVVLDKASFKKSGMENAMLDDCSCIETDFSHCIMKGASMRRCNMRGCNLKGAYLFSAVLEKANLDGVVCDETTKWFKMHCPEKGALVGYKKCVNDRLVQLLIPADAKRTSATMNSCRCSKAKVLTIKSFDGRQEFSEAWSLVDENFVYRKGEWVEVKDFNEDRWMDSTTGIHFWLTKEEAFAY